MKNLVQAGTKTGVAGRRAIAAQAVAGIEAGEFQIGLQTIVCETNAQLVAAQALPRGFHFGAVGESASERCSDIRAQEIAERLRLIGKFKIEDADGGIEIGANDLTELVLGLFEPVFRLNDAHAAGGDLRLRAVDIERWKGTEAERFFIVVIALLGFFQGLALDRERFACKDNAPITPHGLKNDVIHFALKDGARLMQISLGYENGSAIREQAEVPEKRLSKCELEIAGKGWIDET